MSGIPFTPGAAIIDGRKAYLLAALIRDVDLPAAAGRLNPEDRTAALDAVDAIRIAGAVWQRSVSSERNDETSSEPDAAPSDADDRMTVKEAAVRLGITERRAQQLAPKLGGVKGPGGVWQIPRQAVEDRKATA